MASKQVYIDDLDGKTEGAETVFFSLNDVFYRVDLGPANMKKLTDFLAPYVEAGTEVDAPKGGRRTPVGSFNGDAEPAVIRAWLTRNGHTVSDKGRIPEDLAAKYYAAQK